jgi:hypothetical protein
MSGWYLRAASNWIGRAQANPKPTGPKDQPVAIQHDRSFSSGDHPKLERCPEATMASNPIGAFPQTTSYVREFFRMHNSAFIAVAVRVDTNRHHQDQILGGVHATTLLAGCENAQNDDPGVNQVQPFELPVFSHPNWGSRSHVPLRRKTMGLANFGEGSRFGAFLALR